MEKTKRTYVPEPTFPECKREVSTGFWYLIARHEGDRIRKSTGEKVNQARAIKRAKEMYADFLGTAQESGRVRYRDVEAEINSLKKQGKSFSTHNTYDVSQRLHLLPFFGHMRVRDITEEDWFKYVEAERKKTKPKEEPRQLDHDWRYFNEVMKRAFERGHMKIRIRIPNPDPEDEEGREYTDPEIQRLFEEAPEDLRLQMKIALTMGNRKREILYARFSPVPGVPFERQPYPWMDLQAGRMHIPSKAEKTRRVGLLAINSEVLLELKKRHLSRQSEFIFPGHLIKKGVDRGIDPNRPIGSNETSWAACKVRAKVEGHFHWLRHTCATRLARAGWNRSDIGKYLRMSEKTLNTIYRHLNSEEQVKIAETVIIPKADKLWQSGKKRLAKVLKI